MTIADHQVGCDTLGRSAGRFQAHVQGQGARLFCWHAAPEYPRFPYGRFLGVAFERQPGSEWPEHGNTLYGKGIPVEVSDTELQGPPMTSEFVGAGFCHDLGLPVFGVPNMPAPMQEQAEPGKAKRDHTHYQCRNGSPIPDFHFAPSKPVRDSKARGVRVAKVHHPLPNEAVRP